MKKIAALLCVILVAFSMSACRTFNDDKTQNYPQDNPLENTLFLQIKQIPTESTVGDELTKWRSKILTAIADESATKIVDVKFRTESEISGTYTVDLIINNVPDSTVQKTIRPFKITYTQKIYNPIAILPNSDVFTYVVAYESTKKHSASNADEITKTNENGYVYFWSTGTVIEFIDIYPNRPLYYLIIVVGATIIGVLVYLISRYSDCKKHKKQL